MAKADLLKDAQKQGLVPDSAGEDEFTVAQLEQLLNPERAAWEGSLSADKPIVAPDGHVVLSQEDIDARQ